MSRSFSVRSAERHAGWPDGIGAPNLAPAQAGQEDIKPVIFSLIGLIPGPGLSQLFEGQRLLPLVHLGERGLGGRGHHHLRDVDVRGL